MTAQRLCELRDKGYITESEYFDIQQLEVDNTMLVKDFYDTLDKIRTEIAELRHSHMINFVDNVGMVNTILTIIDKYREVNK